jgi:hypothetical protein
MLRICVIPFDVKETILEQLDNENDLLQLALTNREWKALIIPFHIEYRTLRIQTERDRPEVWQHLAQNKYLASRIKAVILGHNFRASSRPLATCDEPDIYPRTFPHAGNDQDIAKATRLAFANMASLETFYWSLDYLSPKSEDLTKAYFREVFEGLRMAGTVKHLTLTEQRRYGTKRCPDELKDANHPVCPSNHVSDTTTSS